MAHGAFEIIVFWLVGCAAVADAWVPVTAAARTRVSTTTTISRVPLLLGHTASVSLTRLQLAAAGGGGGFGGGGGGSSGNDNSNKKEVKLKPKQQWDRYTTVLKKETPVAVAVRVVSGGADGAWFEVGTIKSQGDSMTPIAVARQRALLAEHAKRLYPLQVSSKAQLEWGYQNKDSGDADAEDSWVTVDKAILEGAPDGVEKLIGFEGKPDPPTGYYCVYNEGRLVKSTDSADLNLRPSSKKLG